MPTVLQSYTVLLSRPGDANHYAEIAVEALEAINHQHSLSTGIHFHLLDWTKDSYADSGAEPQQLLNRQIVDKADIVLAIFKERMGTPTQRFDSGTEEEIMLALEAHKTVQAYFWQPPKGIMPADPAQYERLESFKARISDSLIYATFSDEQELRKKVTHDFTRRMFDLEDEKPVRRPTLGLATIGPDGKPSHQLATQPPALGGGYSPKALDDSVRSAFEKVSAIELPKPEPQESPRAEGESPLSSAFASFQIQLASSKFSESLLGGIESAGVKKDDRALVTSVLGELGVEVPQDLFYVGGAPAQQAAHLFPCSWGRPPRIQRGESEILRPREAGFCLQVTRGVRSVPKNHALARGFTASDREQWKRAGNARSCRGLPSKVSICPHRRYPDAYRKLHWPRAEQCKQDCKLCRSSL